MDHGALGRPFGRSHPTAIFHYTRLKPFADKPEHAPVCNPVSQKHQHPFMVDLIKERRDIRIQYPVHLLALQRDR
jgi:site-specific DNA recombinase